MIIATVNSTGNKMAPLSTFQGQRVPVTRVCNPNSCDSLYEATDSSFVQGPFFLSIMKKFKEYMVESGLDDGKPPRPSR